MKLSFFENDQCLILLNYLCPYLLQLCVLVGRKNMRPQLEHIAECDLVAVLLNHVFAVQLVVLRLDGIRLGNLLYLVSVGKRKRAHQMIFVRIRKFDGEYPFRLDKRIPFQLRKDHRVDVKPSACVLGVHHEVELFFYLRKVIRIAFHFQAFESELFFAGIRRGEQQGVLLLFEQLLPLVYRGVSKNERKQLAMEALKSVGLEDRMKHKPNEMSGGQQQRVAVARAVAAKPPIILADEPTGNLDTKSTQEIMEILKELHR